MTLPSTFDRVSSNTCEESNERIRRETEQNIARAAAGGLEAINERLQELEEEWDIERYVETMAPSLTLAGLLLGVTVSKKWLILSGVVQAFFLQHALQGWCPPVPVLRSMGVRTVEEIEAERYALKALRGDFVNVDSGAGRERRAFDAVMKRM